MEHEVEPLKAEKSKKSTIKEKYQSLMSNITIEPVLACSTIPVTLSRLATQNLNLDKACRLNLKYGDKVCDALIARKGDMFKTEEAAVQEVISGMEIWQSVLYRAVPCFIILFVGAWSDRTGRRKICILLPIVGDLLACISNIINTYFFYELPLELCMFMEAFFPSLTGGWITMYMGAFSYIGDVSSEETRTFRVGVANLCLTAGGPIGMALSGVLLEQIGYYGVFSLSSVLYLFSILYGIYYIRDPNLSKPEEYAEGKGFLKSFFDLKHAKDTVTVAFKKGPNHRRIKAIMVLAGIVFIYGPGFVVNTFLNTMEHEVEPLKSEKPKKSTIKEKYQSLMSNITIEPVLACSTIPISLSKLATQNLNLDKACRLNLKYGDKVCDALIARKGDMFKTEEAAVQEVISGMEIWQSVLYRAVPCFIILFVGAWSDRTGRRKICILLPIVGDLLACISNIINTYFFYELPLELCMFMEAFFPSLTGGWITMYMGAFSYIGDVSSEETRTFRVGVANLCLTAGGPIGMALSGVLLEQIGYYGVFSLSSVLYLFSILYGIYYIQDPKLSKPEENAEGKGFLKSFFDLKHAKDTVTVAFKKGPNHRRIKAIMVLAGIIFIHGPGFGDMSIRYLYSRYRFSWDAVTYSFYKTFYIVMHAIGALVSVAIFSRKFQWDDSVLGLISTVSKTAGALATGLAQNSFHMYLAVVIETFNASSFTALRSISSKLAASDELGKMTSIFNLTEVITSMNFGPLFSWMYMMTLKFNPSFAYYVSAGITVVAVFIFGWFYKVHKESVKKKKSIEIDNCEDKNDDNDRRNSNTKNTEDHVTCNIELTGESIVIS